MLEEVERWFRDPNFGDDWQDTDLILCEVAPFSRLRDYLLDASAPMSKKTDVIMALLEMLEHKCPRDGGSEAAQLANDIKTTIRRHPDIAEKTIPDLGPIKEVVLRIILGLAIPSGYPQWVIDRAHEEGA